MRPEGDIDSVNHVGVAVRHMAQAETRYQALGFTLSPLSVHSGSMKRGDPVQPMATGNRCAIFPNNYVEVLGVVNPGLPSWGWMKFVEKFEGAHIICFGCRSASAVDVRAKAAALTTSGVIRLQRDVETAQGMKTARFDCVHFDAALNPEGLIQTAHHLDPEVIHQPRYLEHENGATALDEVILVTMDPEAEARKYGLLTNLPPGQRDHRWEIVLPRVSRLVFVGPESAAKEFPGSLVAPAPSIAGLSFPVKDLARTAALLEERKFDITREGARVLVPAEQALGVVHVFTQA